MAVRIARLIDKSLPAADMKMRTSYRLSQQFEPVDRHLCFTPPFAPSPLLGRIGPEDVRNPLPCDVARLTERRQEGVGKWIADVAI